ncbi:MAG: tryptophan synthase subunit alpha [Salinivirgaceae bacterium]|nr:tryptophan synthase subunit alpha [Salinivirgaceae bacterium]
MNRINQLFKDKQNSILSIYFTAGHPEMGTTKLIIEELEKNEVDMIEIGIPFSDPLADGPVIQQSSQKALENGMTLKKLLAEIKDIRHKVKIPLLLMGYFNTVFQYGVEAFCSDIKSIGIDGVILPDMPIKVYEAKYQKIFEKYGIIPVFLITPETSEERIRKIDKLSKGFIYMVSSSSTTGIKNKLDEKSIVYFKRIKEMNLKNQLIAGFGISNKETFDEICKYANGGIIGSAFVKAIETGENLLSQIKRFIATIKY